MKSSILALALALAFSFTAVPADAATDLEKCIVHNAKIKMSYAKCLEQDSLLVAKGKTPKGNCESRRAASLEKATAKFVTELGVNADDCRIDLAPETEAQGQQRFGAGVALSEAQICSGDPCIVSGEHRLVAGEVLDLGNSATLQISSDARILLEPGGSEPATIRAGTILVNAGASFLMEPSTIVQARRPWVSDLHLSATTLIEIGAESGPPVMGLRGPLLKFSAGGDLTVLGPLELRGVETDGGSLNAIAGGNLRIIGSLDLSADRTPQGQDFALESGGLTLEAAGLVSIPGDVQLGSADGSAGSLDVQAGGDIQISGAIAIAGGNKEEGDGGAIYLHSLDGDIRLTGGVTGSPGSSAEDCGGAVEIELNASPFANIELCSRSRATGSGNIFLDGVLDVPGDGGPECEGALLSACATGRIEQGPLGELQANSKRGVGGSLNMQAPGGIKLGAVDLSSVNGTGGLVDAIATSGEIRFVGGLDTSGGRSGFDFGGIIYATACRIAIEPGSEVLAGGSTNGCFPSDPDCAKVFAVANLAAGDQLRVAGRLEAGHAVRLATRGRAPELIGSVSPAPEISVLADLPTCGDLPGVCGDGTLDPEEVCDDGNTVDCDGCRGDCRATDAVCGDSILECDEQCDDGNNEDDDGCSAECRLPAGEALRIPGPIARSGCLAAWKLRGDSLSVIGSGVASRRQFCTDGDPGCDQDGVANGQCELAASVCFGSADADVPQCAATTVARATLKSPRFPRGPGVIDSNAITIADAFERTGVTVFSGTRQLYQGTSVASGTCTSEFALQIGAGRRARFDIGARTGTAQRRKMVRNPLHVECLVNTATCGNGKLETGESCDDGNTDDCDGCSSRCVQEACGNGVLECTEECEPGTGAGDDDRCSETCQLQAPAIRIPGGARRTDCRLSWALEQAPETLLVDRSGNPSRAQECRDGDPECDFDPASGVCAFHVWACLGEADERISCVAEEITGVRALGSRRQAATLRIAAALAELDFPLEPGGECSRMATIRVPAGGRPVSIGARAETASGGDRDRIRLGCRP